MKTLICLSLSFLITLATPTIALADCLPDYEGPCNDTVGGASKNNDDNLIAFGIVLSLGIWYFSERQASEKTFSARNNDIDKKLGTPQHFTVSGYFSTGHSIGSSNLIENSNAIESIGLKFTYKF